MNKLNLIPTIIGLYNELVAFSIEDLSVVVYCREGSFHYHIDFIDSFNYELLGFEL
jgi:hypothetical protein